MTFNKKNKIAKAGAPRVLYESIGDFNIFVTLQNINYIFYFFIEMQENYLVYSSI